MALAMQPCSRHAAQISRTPTQQRALSCPAGTVQRAALCQRRAGRTLVLAQAATVEKAGVETRMRWPRWEVVSSYLTREQGLASTPPAEAEELISSGQYVLIDIRPAKKFEDSHPEGAINVQLYKFPDLSKPSVSKYLRALLLASQGVTPVEANETFLEELVAAADGKGVILACEVGGTLAPTENFPFGKSSRSLMAAFKVFESGVLGSKVKHLKGGVYGWQRAGLPFVGEYDAVGAGRTPAIVEEEIFSYGREVQKVEDY